MVTYHEPMLALYSTAIGSLDREPQLLCLKEHFQGPTIGFLSWIVEDFLTQWHYEIPDSMCASQGVSLTQSQTMLKEVLRLKEIL